MKFRWVKTCDICPEQYDVYKGCVLVAYVRFRCGRLTAFCPNSRGRKIYNEYGEKTPSFRWGMNRLS